MVNTAIGRYADRVDQWFERHRTVEAVACFALGVLIARLIGLV